MDVSKEMWAGLGGQSCVSSPLLLCRENKEYTFRVYLPCKTNIRDYEIFNLKGENIVNFKFACIFILHIICGSTLILKLLFR